MDTAVLTAATSAAICAGAVTRAVVYQPRRLTGRVRPYTAAIRARLGTTQPETPTGSTAVWTPMLRAAGEALSRVVDIGSVGDAEQRLRHAGLAPIGIDGYRNRQLGYTAAGIAAGVLLGSMLARTPAGVVLVTLMCTYVGATRWRGVVNKAITERRDRMIAELPTVCQLLAVYLRTGDTIGGAIDRLCQRGDSPVICELRDSAAAIRSGWPAPTILDRAATDAATPGAARLYRQLGASWQSGGDPDALLALSDDLQAIRREELTRAMAKREVTSAIPLVVVLAPILLLFVGAALPSLLRFR